MPALSQGLRLLLLHEPQSHDAVDGILASPALHAEVTAALPALMAARDASMVPAAPTDVFAIIGRRFATYPQPERSDAEWAAFWDDYYDALQGVPLEALGAAMRAWVKTDEQFLPKPGQLRKLADAQPNPALIAAHRARLAAEREPRRLTRDPDIQKGLADLLAGIGTKPVSK